MDFWLIIALALFLSFILLGCLLYGIFLLFAWLLSGLKVIYDRIQMAPKNPSPLVITDWNKEKDFPKN